MIRTTNRTWPRPPAPEPDVQVVVDKVRRLTASSVAVVEGTDAEGHQVRCLLPTELTLDLGRQVACGLHPSVRVPPFAVVVIPD